VPGSPTPTPTPTTTGYTNQDPGGCNCGCSSCYPCTLPESDLLLSYNNGPTKTLTYSSTCMWTSPCIARALSVSAIFTISCSGSCVACKATNYSGTTCSGSPTGYSAFNDPANCEDAVNNLFLTSFTCSPLHILFTEGGSGDTWTITA
jgi:hypothetical protein